MLDLHVIEKAIMPIYTIAGIIITFHCNLKRKSFKSKNHEREREREVAVVSINLRVHHQSYVVSLKKNPP
jgi:hypothetical protein